MKYVAETRKLSLRGIVEFGKQKKVNTTYTYINTKHDSPTA